MVSAQMSVARQRLGPSPPALSSQMWPTQWSKLSATGAASLPDALVQWESPTPSRARTNGEISPIGLTPRRDA